MSPGHLRHTARNRIGRRRGAALVLVIGVMFVLLALGTGSLYYGSLNRILATRDGQQIMARAAADSGLKKAVSAMDSYVSGSLPSAAGEALPGCMATYSYEVTQAPDSTYSVTATGTSGTAVRTVGGKLKVSSSLWSAVSLAADVSLSSSSQILPAAGSSLKVRTNSVASGGVSLSSSAMIYGDVIVGPGGNPATVINDPSRVTGTKAAASQALSLPALTPPSDLPNLGSVTISSSQVLSSNARYSSLTIKSATVQIQGNVVLYVVGSMTIQSSSQLLVRDGSSLTIYAGGTFSLQSSSTIREVNLRPERLQIYGTSTCSAINLASSSTAYAAIYAPAARCSLNSSSTLVGVFSGQRLSLSSSSTLRYSNSVDGQCLYGTNTYTIDRWWED